MTSGGEARTSRKSYGGLPYGKGGKASLVGSGPGGACAQQSGLAVLGAVEPVGLITRAHPKGALADRARTYPMLHGQVKSTM